METVHGNRSPELERLQTHGMESVKDLEPGYLEK